MGRLDVLRVHAPSLSATNCLRAAITLVLIGLFSPTLLAVFSIWDGGGGNDNWTTGANWLGFMSPGVAPPNNGTADIVFPATGGLVQTPLVDVPYSILSLSFSNGDGRFVILAAAELTIGAGGITNNDADIQSVIGPLKLSANQTWTAAAGPLQIDAVNFNTSDLDLAGAYPIDLISAISGSGQLKIVSGYTSTVTMSGGVSNTYTDSTVVQGGTLVLQKTSGAVAVPGEVFIYSGAILRLAANEQIAEAPFQAVKVNAGGLFDVNSHTETVANLSVFSGGSVTVGATGKLTTPNAYVSGTWTNAGQLFIGDSAYGLLNIVSGGDVTSANGYIGNAAGVTGEVTVDGTGSTWTNSGDLFVGNAGNGTLDINSGAQVTSASGYLGYESGASGEVTVDGANSIWTTVTGGDLYVGKSGIGTMNVTGGGEVRHVNGYIGDQAGSTGNVTVDGMNSNWVNLGSLYVGNAGSGTLNISAGGNVHSSSVSGGGRIGSEFQSTGVVTVAGTGSTWVIGVGLSGLVVGGTGNGTLEILAGGRVDCGVVEIGRSLHSTGLVRVDGSFSLLDLSGPMIIGDDGDGTLEITNGGRVFFPGSTAGADFTYIGFRAGTGTGSTGHVRVDGADSLWDLGGAALYVGYSGKGRLDITSGAQFHSGSVKIGGQGAYSTGIVTIDGAGSTLTSNILTVGAIQSGIVMLSNGGKIFANEIGIGKIGELLGEGDINGIAPGLPTVVSIASDGQLRGQLRGDFNVVGNVQNGGLVSPGASPGMIFIVGDYTQLATGELLIELASAGYDQLHVTDNAILGGTLTVNLLDGFMPGMGQTFTILTADDVDGTFASEVLPTVPNLGFDVIYNVQSVVLSVFSALPGDYNGDGAVDAADYVVWRKNVGAATLNNRDPNGMGAVGQADYDFWRMHFGETVGIPLGAAASADAAVPEPSSQLMLVLGMLPIFFRRRAVVS